MNKQTEDQGSQKSRLKKLKDDVIDLVRFGVIVLAIIIPLRIFVAQPFVVNGDSMFPSLENGNYLIVDQLTYRTQDVERGDVIVFRFPNSDQRRFLIKRVIGVPGETVILANKTVTVKKLDGTMVELDETYIKEDFSAFGTYELGETEYFVMGDNRNFSSDSRSWGVLEEEYIVGKTLMRLFPIKDFGKRPAEVEPEDIEIIIEA